MMSDSYRRGYDKGFEDGARAAGESGIGVALVLIGLGVLVTLFWHAIVLGAHWLWLQL